LEAEVKELLQDKDTEVSQAYYGRKRAATLSPSRHIVRFFRRSRELWVVEKVNAYIQVPDMNERAKFRIVSNKDAGDMAYCE
jgi:hypothetical protein